MAKYIFVSGGVVSGTGKGVAAASIAYLLKQRGHSIQYVKFDPFLNINSGILSPNEHGENFVLDDGSEVDLDAGHVFRIAGLELCKKNVYTAGTIYKELIEEQERGEYLGQTIQSAVHVANKIKDRLLDIGKNATVVLAEIGGTVGDPESACFYEAVRQFIREHNDSILMLVAPILYINTIKEFKTKPLQNAVKALQMHGLQPDILLCRVDRELPSAILDKVATLTNVERPCVFDAPDVDSIYSVAIEFYNRHLDDLCVDLLRMKRSACRIHKHKELVEKKLDKEIKIGVVGKYGNAEEAYMSLKEALKHAGLHEGTKVVVEWIDAGQLEQKNSKEVKELLSKVDGIIIPGGFDNRGVEGKIKAIQVARENKIPFLGICLGLQCAMIEYARNVAKLPDANSQEFDRNCANPVVWYLKGQETVGKVSSMRLGAYDCELIKGSLAFELYGKKLISERHRHRLEVNPKYADLGFIVSGTNPQSNLIEIMELPRDIHPFFIGTQAHPEFKSKLSESAPLFKGLVHAAMNHKNGGMNGKFLVEFGEAERSSQKP